MRLNQIGLCTEQPLATRPGLVDFASRKKSESFPERVLHPRCSWPRIFHLTHRCTFPVTNIIMRWIETLRMWNFDVQLEPEAMATSDG